MSQEYDPIPPVSPVLTDLPGYIDPPSVYTDQSPNSYLLPLDGVWESADKAFDAINEYVLDYGYAFVKLRSKSTRLYVLKTVWLKCDRGGQYKNSISDQDRKRSTNTGALGYLC